MHIRTLKKNFVDRESGKLLFVAWLRLCSYTCSTKNELKNFCSLELSIPFFDVSQNEITNDIYQKMCDEIEHDINANIDGYFDDICVIISKIKGIQNLYLPDFFIKDNDLDIAAVNAIIDFNNFYGLI
jgi:hypothetical protein